MQMHSETINFVFVLFFLMHNTFHLLQETQDCNDWKKLITITILKEQHISLI